MPLPVLPGEPSEGADVRVLPGAEPFTHDGGPVGVLLCHGFTGTPQSLRPWAHSLADAGLSVRLPRLPGHGTTWQAMNRTRWEDWYAVVQGELADLRRRCERVIVGGLSMGGALATRLAQRQPADVAGLVLVNPGFALADPRLAALPLLKAVLPSVPGPAGDIARPGVSELGYDRAPLRALHSYVHSLRDTVRDLPTVTQPLLLLRSAVDHVIPPKSADLLLARISSKDVTTIVLERSYHVATLDHDAETIERESLAFVRRVAA
jgi:carboxylesterase